MSEDAIDFIKWMCEKAEWFEYIGNGEINLRGGKSSIEYSPFKDIHYPLLLQRAIEGVNREGEYEIVQYQNSVYIPKGRKEFEFYKSTEDQAKESALKYIYEQEKLNDNRSI